MAKISGATALGREEGGDDKGRRGQHSRRPRQGRGR